jgi:deazaflavin-dependent oxidoreductase (nitroreductase family)
MAKKYQVDRKIRTLNFLAQSLAWLGVGPSVYHILTTTGRKSGKPRRTPVIVMKKNGQRWIVSPYGETGWVKNVRAGGEVSIRRGLRREGVRLEEVDAPTAVSILQDYVRDVPITRPYFDVTADSPEEAFVAEAPRHPVFRVVTKNVLVKGESL